MSSKVPIVWQPVGGSVRGAAHEVSGVPNQDSWLATEPGEFAAAAVADGHGSAKSLRSAVGSHIAVELAVEALDAAGRAARSPEDLAAFLRERTGPWIVHRWRERVLEHLAATPFTPEDLAVVGTPAPKQWENLRAYGCTLVGLCATPYGLGLLQIGDGDAVAVQADGPTAMQPVPEDPANVAQFTSSLCQDDPLAALRVAVVDTAATPLLLAFGSTDGFGTAYADVGWWSEVGPQLAGRAAKFGPAAFAEKIPGYLAEPARVAGDDTTMALLLATGPDAPQLTPETVARLLEPPAVAAEPTPDEPTPDEPAPPTPQPPPEHRAPVPAPAQHHVSGRVLVLSGFSVAGLLAGAGVLTFTLTNGGGAAKPTPPASPPPTAQQATSAPGPELEDYIAVASRLYERLVGKDDGHRSVPQPQVQAGGGLWGVDGSVLRWQPKSGDGFPLYFPTPLEGLELAEPEGGPTQLLVVAKNATWALALTGSCPGGGVDGCTPTCEEVKADGCARPPTAKAAPTPSPSPSRSPSPTPERTKA